ncbi:MAG TPA: HAD family hydrolase, partial [Candidatus Altiarchaeales archaeon]|nr:HAD family hydrolase [Candidatus Altiarchaeales archaeon]
VMPKAVILDVDGTLIDSIGSIWEQYKVVSSKLGLPKTSFQKFARHLGKPWRNVLLGIWPDLDPDEFSGHYDFSKETSKPIPGVNDALNVLSKKYRLIILTSRGSETMDDHLHMAHIDTKLFERIFHRNNTVHHKPDPKVFDEVLAQMGVEKSDAIYVGDSLVDSDCAVSAKVPFVGVLTGAATAKEFGSAGLRYIKSVAELPGYLETLE